MDYVDAPRLIFDIKNRSFPILVPENPDFSWATPENGKTGMMTDFAAAARNAGSSIWSCRQDVSLDDQPVIAQESKFDWGMCASHVFGRWMEKHGKVLRTKANQSRMNIDFQNFKNTPVYLLAHSGLLFDKMMYKWNEIYSERQLTQKFQTQWRGVPCTRVEVNHIADVPGGMPDDTNSVEATHRNHQLFDKNIRFDGDRYIGLLAKWIEHKSVNDMGFGVLLSQPVCCKSFFVAVRDMIDSPISPLTVCFHGTHGRLVCASQRTLNNLKGHPTAPTTAADFRVLVSAPRRGDFGQTAPSMVDSFLIGTEKPSQICSALDFDQCVAWGESFYFLTPIIAGDYLQGLFDRLKNSGLVIEITYDELVAMGAKGLMSCSCSAFLHRAWCIHSCVCAFIREIIVGYPKYKDPTPRAISLKGRRPAKVRKTTPGPWERNYESADTIVDDIPL